jgi:hypothetical protein
MVWLQRTRGKHEELRRRNASKSIPFQRGPLRTAQDPSQARRPVPQTDPADLAKAIADSEIGSPDGATAQQLMAMYDWSTPAQAEVNIRAANRTKLAVQVMPLLRILALCP